MILLPDKRITIPSEIVIMDALTVGSNAPDNPLEAMHTLKAGYFLCARREKNRWTRQKSYSVKSVAECTSLLNQLPGFSRPTYLFSLNLIQTATAVGFWELLESGDYTLSRTVQRQPLMSSNGRRSGGSEKQESGLVMESGTSAAIVAWTKAGAKVIATDVRNYVDAPVKFFGRGVGIDWPDTPYEDSPFSDWEECTQTRAVILYRTVCELIEFWNDNRLGTWGLTAGACALSMYRNSGMTHRIDTPDDDDVRDFERLAYYGGIAECRWVGCKIGNRYKPHPLCQTSPDLFHDAPKGTLHLVDASSFYGSVHLNHDVPCELLNVGESLDPDQWGRIITDDSFIAECRIESVHRRYPVRVNDRTVYANGRFTTVLCGPELHTAIRNGDVKGIGRWHRYKLLPAFHDCILKTWELRTICENGKRISAAAFCKQLIAALHGKFAQRKQRWDICPDAPCIEPWGSWQHFSVGEQRLINYRAIGSQVQRETDAGDAAHCFPAIAAWTTACGRQTIRMWEWLARPHNVLYLNTDSMIVTDDGLQRLSYADLVGSDECGALHVKASSTDIEIRGAGCFSFAGRLWMSGINRTEDQLIFGTVHHQSREGLAGVIARKGKPCIRVVTHELSPGWYFDPLRTSDDGWISPPRIDDGASSWIFDHSRNMTEPQSL